MKLLVPGEQERVVVSLEEEKKEEEGVEKTEVEEEKNGAEEPVVTANVGEKCEVWRHYCDTSFNLKSSSSTGDVGSFRLHICVFSSSKDTVDAAEETRRGCECTSKA